MGRGGARPGAGRKPKPKDAVVIGMDGIRREVPAVPVLSVEEQSALTAPPDGLTEKQQAFWRRWAPHAIEQGTLIPATVAGFRELATQYVIKEEMEAGLAILGVVNGDADRLLKRYEKIVQRVDASLARFKLTAFGKPAGDGTRAKKATAPSPWAKVAGR